jgi:hypothetical protein
MKNLDPKVRELNWQLCIITGQKRVKSNLS